MPVKLCVLICCSAHTFGILLPTDCAFHNATLNRSDCFLVILLPWFVCLVLRCELFWWFTSFCSICSAPSGEFCWWMLLILVNQSFVASLVTHILLTLIDFIDAHVLTLESLHLGTRNTISFYYHVVCDAFQSEADLMKSEKYASFATAILIL